MFSVGEILKQGRLKKGLTLEAIEATTKVRAKFLKKIEENEWSFAPRIYIAGIIKTYANILDLDPKKILAFFRRDFERKEGVRFKRKIASSYLSSPAKRRVVVAMTIVFFGFFIYFFLQLKSYLMPPTLQILSPRANEQIKEDRVKIIGKTEKDAVITILGDRVYQNKDGTFEYSFPLHAGKNGLRIEVVGANGKKTIAEKSFYRIDRSNP